MSTDAENDTTREIFFLFRSQKNVWGLFRSFFVEFDGRIKSYAFKKGGQMMIWDLWSFKKFLCFIHSQKSKDRCRNCVTVIPQFTFAAFQTMKRLCKGDWVIRGMTVSFWSTVTNLCDVQPLFLHIHFGHLLSIYFQCSLRRYLQMLTKDW
jgi:hypothetical protein